MDLLARSIPVLVALVLAGGCARNQASSPSAAAANPVADPFGVLQTRPTTPQDPVPEPETSPQALAKTTEEYARSVATPRPQADAAPLVEQVPAPERPAEQLAAEGRTTPVPAVLSEPIASAEPKTAPILRDAVVSASEDPVTVPEGQEIGYGSPPAAGDAAPQAAAGTDLVARLRNRVSASPDDLAAQLDYQLALIAAHQDAPDIVPLAPLSPEDRDLITAVVDGVANLQNGLRREHDWPASDRIQPLVAMANRLESTTDLRIPSLAVCREVKAYGVYEPIAAGSLQAGGGHNEVLVYCEVANFRSTPTADQRWQTDLSVQISLYDDSGRVLAKEDSPAAVSDLSRSRRSDFFIVRRYVLPPTVPAGQHILKVTVTDQTSRRVAERSLLLDVSNSR